MKINNTTTLIMNKFLTLLLLLVSGFTYGQSPTHWSNILKVTSDYGKSPEVAAIERYGTYPVNYSVGIPDITIPIYTINTGKLELPISMSYHLGGVRVNDIASWIGLGWSLKSNGSISRQMNGTPDETGLLGNTTFTFTNLNNNQVISPVPVPDNIFSSFASTGTGIYENMKLYFDRLIYNTWDSQADIYNYQGGAISGSFTYNLNREIVKVPYSDNKIIRNANNTFTIISDNGTRYNFNDTETKSVMNAGGSADYISNWLLSEIVSPDATDTIRFNYTSLYTYDDSRISRTVSEGYYLSGKNVSVSEDANKIESSNTTITSKERLLASIVFRNGSVVFEQSAEKRKDKRDYNLKSITVKNTKGEQQKKVSFEYGYFSSNGNSSNKNDFRLKLDRLKIWGKDDSHPPLLYYFSYNTNVIMPPYNDFGQDYWGFYNGVMSNTHLVGVMPSTSKSLSSKANRNPSEQYMKACILTQIDYPTGGYTVFDTEPNKSDDGTQLLGGLRISKIRSRANSSDPELTTRFTYENAESVYNPAPDQYTYKMGCYGSNISIADAGNRIRTFYTETPFSGLGYYSGSSVIYKKVTKYETTGSVNNGKIVYTYGTPSIFSYSTMGSSSVFPNIYNRYVFCKIPRSWAMGHLLKEESYAEGLTTPIKTINYEYTTYTGNEPLVGKSVFNRFICYDASVAPIFRDAKDYYEYYWIYTSTGYQKLKKQIEAIYDKTTNQTITQTYEFDYGIINDLSPSNLLITKKTSYVNNGDKITETYKYPQDLAGVSVYNDMVSKNRLSEPIEIITNKNTTEISRKKREYGYFPSLQPASDQSSTKSSVYRTDIAYNLYDHRGNLRQYTLSDGTSGVFLWGYKGRFPIAEIKNTTYNDITQIIPDATIRSIAEKAEPSTSDWQSINGLKTNPTLDQAISSTYSYEPLTGLLISTSPAGISSYYNYDLFGRLKEIRNADNQLKSSYQYEYTGKAFPTAGLALSVNSEYPVNKDNWVYATATGGSGNFQYSWVLKNSSGTVLSSSPYSTDNSFKLNFSPSQIGLTMNLTCNVKDSYTERVITSSRTFNVVKPFIEYSNVQTSGGYGSLVQTITANIDCYDQVTARFRVKVNVNSGSVNVNFVIGSRYIQRSYTCDETVDIILPKGINYIEMKVTKGSSYDSGYASLSIESIVSGNNKVGDNSLIYTY